MRVVRGRRGRSDADDGFVLLESIIAIALITVLMVALTSLFLTAMQTNTHQRALQGAVRIATDEIDHARGLGYAGALAGRDKTSVQAQFAAAPAAVLRWLSTRSDQAYQDDAAVNSGHTACAEGATEDCAQLPTVTVTRSISATDFGIDYYEEWCYRDATDKTTADCIPSASKDPGVTYNQYLRVVVDIGWSDTSCPEGGCSYISSVLLNGTAEPLFYFNDQPPPVPDLSACAPPAVVIGDVYSTEDSDNPALDIVGSDGFCPLDGGVPPFTWSGTGLPKGLAITTAGEVTGTVADDAATVTGATVTITDAFLIQDTSAPFTWTVLPRLALSSLADQTSTAGTSISTLTTTASGGNGAPYTWTVTGLPPGITSTPAGTGNAQLRLTGTPTTGGTYHVTVTVRDSATTRVRTTSVSFAWRVYAPLAIADPGPQAGTVSVPIAPVPLAVSGGSGQYSLTLTGALPDGLTLTGDAQHGYSIGGTPTTATSARTVTVSVSDLTSGQHVTLAIAWTIYALPTIAPPDDQTTGTDQDVSVPLAAVCGNAPCTYSADGLPDGLSIGADGVISGTTGSSAQSTTVTVTVTDHAGASATTAPFAWNVVLRPRLAPIGTQHWAAGQPVSVPNFATASCPSGGCTFAVSGLPTGLSLASDTGTLSGTAPDSAAGLGSATVTVTDTAGQHDSVTFAWQVYGPPTIGVPTTVNSLAGQSVSAAVPFTCDLGPCTISASGLPGSLAVDGTGTISGSAPTAGSFPATLTITDTGLGRSATRSFTWTVYPSLQFSVPSQYSQSSTSVTVDLKSFVSGGSGSYTFTAASVPKASPTGLPSGLALNSTTGKITGKTESLGKNSTKSYSVTFTVTDSAGNAVTTGTVTWTVHGSSKSALSITALPTQKFYVGTPVSIDVWNGYTTGGTTPYTFTVSSGTLPAGLSLDKTTGMLTGTPTTKVTKSTTATIKVTDAKSKTDTASFTWTVS